MNEIHEQLTELGSRLAGRQLNAAEADRLQLAADHHEISSLLGNSAVPSQATVERLQPLNTEFEIPNGAA